MSTGSADSRSIARAPEPPALTDPTTGDWTAADPIAVNERPWSGQLTEGERRIDDHPIGASARLFADDRALYVGFVVEDGHQQAATTRLNGRVWADSCVELFVSPTEGGYVNFEANCCGQFRLGYGPRRADRRLISKELASEVAVETSVPGERKTPSASDHRWWLAATIPFSVLGELVGSEIPHHSGAVWRGNLQCCRGEPAPAYAMWRPSGTPEPDFHAPEAFGRLRFE